MTDNTFFAEDPYDTCSVMSNSAGSRLSFEKPTCAKSRPVSRRFTCVVHTLVLYRYGLDASNLPICCTTGCRVELFPRLDFFFVGFLGEGKEGANHAPRRVDWCGDGSWRPGAANPRRGDDNLRWHVRRNAELVNSKKRKEETSQRNKYAGKETCLSVGWDGTAMSRNG